jgi:elongator complex protein 1
MALLQLKLERKAVDVTISKSGTRLAVLSDGKVAVYALDVTRRPVPMPSLLWSDEYVLEDLGHNAPRQVAFIGDEQVCVLTDNWDGYGSYLWTNEGDQQSLVQWGSVETYMASLDSGSVSSLVTSVDAQKLYLQFQDGALYEVESIQQQVSSLVVKAPSFAPEVKVVEFDGKVRVRLCYAQLGLTSSRLSHSALRGAERFSPTNEYLSGTAHPLSSRLHISSSQPHSIC